MAKSGNQRIVSNCGKSQTSRLQQRRRISLAAARRQIRRQANASMVLKNLNPGLWLLQRWQQQQQQRRRTSTYPAIRLVVIRKRKNNDHVNENVVENDYRSEVPNTKRMRLHSLDDFQDNSSRTTTPTSTTPTDRFNSRTDTEQNLKFMRALVVSGISNHHAKIVCKNGNDNHYAK